MRLKNVGNHKREVVYISIAAVLALGLLSYLVFLVQSLTAKATIVFGTEGLKAANEQTFNFQKYDALMRQIYPGSTTVLSTYGFVTSTKPVVIPTSSIPAATGTIATTTASSTKK